MYRLVRHRGQWSLAYGRPRKRIATGQDDRGRAEAVAGEIWRRLNKPAQERVSELWPAYVADRIANGVAPRRFALWKALEPHFGYKLGKAITKDDCRAYIAARRRLGRSNSTIRTELELLRASLRWHYGNDAPQITAPPPSKPRETFITKEERERLLASIDTPHVRLFVVLALTTGARAGAILDLTWDRVDLAAGTIDFRPAGRDPTNKRRVVVPINERARQALQEARRAALSDYVVEYGGRPVKSVSKALAAAARRSGVKCSANVFRHSAARWMVEAGVSIDQVAQFLGHTSTRITYAVYGRFSPAYMREAKAALDW